ncbi:auxin-responsive protein [Musa troglodytarum]|uniref:Auxin-responsive protein n=1 Tax=Musa troglodytarum TaxID=320322 RepID=A0A9E7L1Y1_9LILI|nr:auxin-responsive protein [Musa troglodytarum]
MPSGTGGGWLPVRSFRRNVLKSCTYVKVAVDGTPYLRKVDLEAHAGYQQLLTALEEMFSCFTAREPISSLLATLPSHPSCNYPNEDVCRFMQTASVDEKLRSCRFRPALSSQKFSSRVSILDEHCFVMLDCQGLEKY